MARKKSSGGGGGGSSWLDTYADMVTLLLTFFVLLFSMSTVKEEEWQKLVMAFQRDGTETDQVIIPSDEVTGTETGENTGSPPSGTGGATTEEGINFDTLYEYLKKFVEQQELESSVDVNKGEQSVFIRFNDAIFFNPDSAVLREDSVDILGFLGDALKQVENELQLVVIAGHTAYVADEYYPVSDWKLSGDRASNVAIYFQDEAKIDKMKLEPMGKGSKYPIATNDTAEGRKENRRVELMILSDKASLQNDEVLDYFLKGTFDENKYPDSGGVSDILFPEGTEESEPVASEPAASGAVSSESATSDTTVSSGAVSSAPTSSADTASKAVESDVPASSAAPPPASGGNSGNSDANSGNSGNSGGNAGNSASGSLTDF